MWATYFLNMGPGCYIFPRAADQPKKGHPQQNLSLPNMFPRETKTIMATNVSDKVNSNSNTQDSSTEEKHPRVHGNSTNDKDRFVKTNSQDLHLNSII